MSGVKDVLKNGWHPDKGTTLKQQVSGVFSRGGDSSQRPISHNVTPLSQLKDPSSFAPPPKRSIAPPPPPPPSSRPTASPEQPQPPPIPARSGSGYSGGAAGGSGASIRPPPLPAGNSGPPRLPPRLPPRPASGASSPVASPSALSAPPPPTPPSQSPSVLNQGAIGRLGAAGISVPGLGIGSGSRTSSPQDSPASSSPSQLGGLQARFAKLGTSASPSAASPTQAPSEGTTFAQKQAALKTAADFHKDPRSVSLSDARAAASTINNFRQRHGDQVAAGVKTANGLNQKYGVTDKVAAYSQQHQGAAASPATAKFTPAAPQQGEAPPGLRSLASAGALAAGALTKKRPPPPPPPKRKPDIGRATTSATTADDEPPPIPHATRPVF